MISERHETPQLVLSAEGQRRRAQILDDAQVAVTTRRRRRNGTRWVWVGLLTTGWLGWVLLSPSPRTSTASVGGPPGSVSHRTTQEHLQELKGVDADTICGDPSMHARAAVEPQALAAETFVDDGELIALLEEAGISAGVVRVEGESSVILRTTATAR